MANATPCPDCKGKGAIALLTKSVPCLRCAGLTERTDQTGRPDVPAGRVIAAFYTHTGHTLRYEADARSPITCRDEVDGTRTLEIHLKKMKDLNP